MKITGRGEDNCPDPLTKGTRSLGCSQLCRRDIRHPARKYTASWLSQPLHSHTSTLTCRQCLQPRAARQPGSAWDLPWCWVQGQSCCYISSTLPFSAFPRISWPFQKYLAIPHSDLSKLPLWTLHPPAWTWRLESIICISFHELASSMILPIDHRA